MFSTLYLLFVITIKIFKIYFSFCDNSRVRTTCFKSILCVVIFFFWSIYKFCGFVLLKLVCFIFGIFAMFLTGNFFFFDPLEQFEVLPVSFLFNSFSFIVCLNFLLLFLLFKLAKRGNIFHFLIEKSILFFKDLFTSIYGHKNYGYFYTFYLTFLIILTNNLIGLLPWAFTATSVLILPFFFSFMNFGATVFIAFETFGLRFFNLFYPKGTPRVILHFLIYIEVVSYFIRLFSLAIRLFANMVAGHALIKILISFAWVLLFSGGLSSIFGLTAWVIIILITILEILIAFLQAYVFVFLSMIYLHEVSH